MIIASIPVRTFDDTRANVLDVMHDVDMIELRLDYAQIIDYQALSSIREACQCLLMFTLRKKSHGGLYAGDEVAHAEALQALAALEPDYFDIEYDVSVEVLQCIQHHYPQVRLLASYHHFDETPEDLHAILNAMQQPLFDGYKIVTYAKTTRDALRMLQFVKQASNTCTLTGFCMGDAGQCSRLLGPVVGNFLTYVCLNNESTTAPGQFTVRESLDVYRMRQVNRHTQIYALIGDPVRQSVGHILHNQAFAFLNQNAVYVKIQVDSLEIASVIAMMRDLPFAGLSVTMPHKNTILSFVDEVLECSRPIQAINTVCVNDQRWVGFNTDGLGAMTAVAQRVLLAHSTVVIIGAGGAARALAYEARQRQAQVIVVNRTLSHALSWALDMGCECYGFEACVQIDSTTDVVLINTLPASAYEDLQPCMWLDKHRALLNGWVMDIVYQPNTLFLQQCRTLNPQVSVILGCEMYVNQAVLQLQQWFTLTDAESVSIHTFMQHYFQTCLFA